MLKDDKFPEGFLWGSATSSYQVEGGIENCDWSEAARRGKIAPAGRACGSYNRYEEDFNIAKSLNQNAHRLSLEWARIEPEEGEFDESAIEHYKNVLDALRERELEPFVTIWHFTLPVWFARKGGFENPESPEIFARYCEYVVSELGDRVKYWMTMNEPMVYASNGYRVGIWPPFKKNFFKFMGSINNLITSHNVSYEKIKNVDPSAQIGIAKNNINFESNYNPFYRLLSIFLDFFWNRRFLNKISEHGDFIGLNYYFHKKFGDRTIYPKSDMGWDIYPRGIYDSLIELRKYSKPIYITENGLADAGDTLRAKFIKEYLHWIHQAISNGLDVRGYFHWSLLDNYEWAYGYKYKFGLVAVNFDTLERKIRPSAYEYAKICKENSLIP